MCGINGYIGKDDSVIARMNHVLAHRGPDGSGVYRDERLTLGHVRLAILDLTEKGHQPMFYSKKQGGKLRKI